MSKMNVLSTTSVDFSRKNQFAQRENDFEQLISVATKTSSVKPLAKTVLSPLKPNPFFAVSGGYGAYKDMGYS
jgi:hypothetical protein